MRILRVTLLAVTCMLAASMQAQAQSCADLFKQANALRNSGKYKEAITYYQKAKACDPNLTKDCNKAIKACQSFLTTKTTNLVVSDQEIVIPYQGSDKLINVTADGKWNLEGDTDWLNTSVYGSKKFVVECREPNNSTRARTATLMVKSGSLFKSIKVTQQGREEYIEASARSLSFPASGTKDSISIESNAHWDVKTAPSWCKIEKSEDGIRITVLPNEKVMERTDQIVVESPAKQVVIKIYQGAGNEHLSLSQNNLVVEPEGDVRYVKVYTDAANWFVGDYPTWMHVQRIGQDSIRIECVKNVPNGQPRSGSVLIRTDRQTAGLLVTQSPREMVDLIIPESKVVGGRNFSFGVSASYYMPFVSASAGGDYCGSVLDYGLGTSQENASYKSAVGYSFGVFADIRLYRNSFLTVGANFTQIKYKNEFNKNTLYTTPLNDNEYLRGEVQNAYTEDYTHTMVEVPILASYRFKINDVSHVQLNLGPVLNFGLSAKMKLSGNTDCETLKKYSNTTHQQVETGNYVRHQAVSAEFDLYKSSLMWTEIYTTGNDRVVEHPETFQDSPLKKINCGLRVGAAYEWAGLQLGLSYTCMLTNMANKNYWENERWTVLNPSNATMKGYKQRIHTLEIKLAYTLRYLKSKK